MISKVSFLIAMILIVLWIFLFLLFSNSLLAHTLVALAFLSLIVSFVTRNN